MTWQAEVAAICTACIMAFAFILILCGQLVARDRRWLCPECKRRGIIRIHWLYGRIYYCPRCNRAWDY